MMTLRTCRKEWDKDVTELPREPKEDPRYAIGHGGGATGKEPEVEFQSTSDFASPLVNNNVIVGSSSLPMASSGCHIPEWGLTRESLLTQNLGAYKWGRHAFPLATIEALELFSNFHMSNSLQYMVSQVAPYLVVAARRLCQINSDKTELASSRAERDELSVKLLGLEEEKRKFEERYDVLVGEKAFVEECNTPVF